MDFDKIYGEAPIAVAVYKVSEHKLIYTNQAAREQFLIDLNVSTYLEDFIKPLYDKDLEILKHIIKSDKRADNFIMKLEDGATVGISGNYIDEFFVVYIIRANDVLVTSDRSSPESYGEIMEHVLQAFCSSRDTVNLLYTILKMVTLYLNVDRAYILEIVDDKHVKCAHEFFTEGTISVKDVFLPLEIMDCFNVLSRGIPDIVDNCDKQKNEKSNVAKPKDTKSFIQFPLISNGALVGIVGFDSCSDYHKWTFKDRRIIEDVSVIIKEAVLGEQFRILATRANNITTTVLDNLNFFTYVREFDTHKLLFANKALRDILGEQYVLGDDCWHVLRPDLSGPCSFCEVGKLVDENGNTKGITNKHDLFNELIQKWLLVTETMIEWFDGRRAVLMTALDITERKEMEQQLEYRASTDSMTGAYSRSWGLRIFEERHEAALAKNQPVTVCFIDIDKLKKVNDEHGHTAGDELIKTICETIKEFLDSGDYFIRLGGDEFLIAFEEAGDEAAQKKIDAILEKLRKINQTGKLLYSCEISYGLNTSVVADGPSLDDIINQADARMYLQKMRSRQWKPD